VAYDDWSDWGDFSLWGGDTPDIGSSFDFGTASQYGGLYGGGFSPQIDAGGWGAGTPQMPIGQGSASPWIGAGLGALGPLAGLIGGLAGGGVTGQSQPQMTTQQKALQGQGTQALGGMTQFAQGTSPLQQQQAGVLGPLGQYLQQMMSGQGMQGLINTLSPMIQQAYAPFAQGLMQQATEAGRRSGFYDAPGTSPPGGAILGPGLAQLQGQQAQSLLQALLQQVPQAAMQGAGAFNQPVNQQIGAAGTQAAGYGGLMGPVGTQQSQPMGNLVGQGLASLGGGIAQGYGAVEGRNQQQANWNALLNMIANQPQRGGLSYT